MSIFVGDAAKLFENTEWISIVTQGEEGPHAVACWGAHIRQLGIQDGDIILVPAGSYNTTESNLKRDPRVVVQMASSLVPSQLSLGRGGVFHGTATVETSGSLAEKVQAVFP
jgi:hypothetical protein